MAERRPAFLKRVAREWWKDDVMYLASAITFDTLVAAVPFMMLVFTLTGLIISHIAPGGEIELTTFLRGVLPRTRVVDLDPLLRVEQLLVGVAERREVVSLLSIPLLFVFATRMFATIRWGLDRVFDAAEPRPMLRQWLTDIMLLLVTGACLMTNGIASMGLVMLATTTNTEWIAPVGGRLVTFGSAVALFVLIFRIAPARRIDWGTAALAGTLSALFFEIAKGLFGLYVRYAARLESMTADVQLAGVMLLLGWFYATAMVFLTAGEIANEYRRKIV